MGGGGGGDKLKIYECYDMCYKECTLDVVVFTVCSLFVYSVIYITPMFDYIINTSLLSENDISIYLPCTGIL